MAHIAPPASPTPAGEAASTHHVGVLIIGAGFSGLGAAITLQNDGYTDFLVVERGNNVGGTWRVNTYPGAACDVPSHLYSFSFALNPDWTRSYSKQPEIEAYLQRVAREHRVLDKHRFGCDVREIRWDESVSRWQVSTSQGEFTANFVVSAVGPLTEPALPNIEGLDGFEGEIFHSARWNHDYDLTGKRVAVIGTGASGIQIIPELAKFVRQLDVYQRTAPWVLPRFDREYSTAERLAFRHVPGYQRAARSAIYWGKEVVALGLTYAPKILAPVQKAAGRNIDRGITDPELRAKVTPRWQIGCKRILQSNTYYPALAQSHVEVITDGIAAVRPNAIVTTDGSVREVDAIVVATGFHVTDSPTNERIFGRGGRSLADTWRQGGAQAYKGSTVHGFPNMIVMTGPGTGLGHTSMVFMIESQLNYLRDLVRTTRARGIATVEVRKDAQTAYNNKIQRGLRNSVWENGGCSSWYRDKFGKITTLWPGFTLRFRQQTRAFDLNAYHTVRAGDLPATERSRAAACVASMAATVSLA
jgi:cation diffusion facilitator CzcD-associated flavoprotein CzcO